MKQGGGERGVCEGLKMWGGCEGGGWGGWV